MEGSLSRVSILLLFALGLIGLVLWRGAADREPSSPSLPLEERSASLAPEPAAMISPSTATSREPPAETPVEPPSHQALFLALDHGRLVPFPSRALEAFDEERVARPHVVVRLLAANGRPLPVPGPRIRTDSLEPSDVFEWPSEPRVMAFAVEAQDDGASLAGPPLEGRRLDTGELEYEVEPGARYLIQARGPGFDGIAHEFVMPTDQDRVVMELQAREVGELGSVSVRVLSRGKELGAFGWAFDVRLESRDGAVPFLETSGIGRGKPVVFRAPPGRYRVVAEGKAAMVGWHGTVQASRALGRGEAEVELRAGLAQEIDLELDEGASLEVALAGDPSQPRSEPAHLPRLWSVEEVQRLASIPYAKLFLLRPGRRSEPVLFEDHGLLGTTASGKHLYDDWPLGETHVSARVPTGRFTLLALFPDGRETRTEIDLRPRETTRVELGF